MEQDTEYIDIPVMYPFVTNNNYYCSSALALRLIVEFIGQGANAANESIHLEIIIMRMRLIALLFFSCKETKRAIKDLLQVYTFWSHWYFLPYFKGMLCYSQLCSKKNLELLTSWPSLSKQILWPLGSYFCLWKSLVEPLYGWVPANINFLMRFLSNCQFSGKILRIASHGNATI